MKDMTNPSAAFAAYNDRNSENVSELQELLKEMGVYAGEITGTFDNVTAEAYQQACKKLERTAALDMEGHPVVTMQDFSDLETWANEHLGRPLSTGKPPVNPWKKRLKLIAIAAAVVLVIAFLGGNFTKGSDDKSADVLPSHQVEELSRICDDYIVTTYDDHTCSIVDYLGGNTILTIPTEIEGYQVTAIGDSAFLGKANLQTITIPDTVTRIGQSAFAFCGNLRTVDVPASVIAIGMSAFSPCPSLSNIYVADGSFVQHYCTLNKLPFALQ